MGIDRRRSSFESASPDSGCPTRTCSTSDSCPGWFIKTLSVLPACFVHWAPTDDPSGAEDAILRSFCRGVSDATRASLLDPEHPFPFANLEWPPGTRKRHGITGAKAALARSHEARPQVQRAPVPIVQAQQRREGDPPEQSTAGDGWLSSQNVTETDLGRNQIRFPARAKSLFPSTKQRVKVRL